MRLKTGLSCWSRRRFRRTRANLDLDQARKGVCRTQSRFMTVLQNTAPAAVSQHQPQRPGLRVGEPEAALREHATPVRARRRQRLALDQAPSESVYIVRSGLLGIEAATPGKHRQL